MKAKLILVFGILGSLALAGAANVPGDGSVLPFPLTPMKDSVAKPRCRIVTVMDNLLQFADQHPCHDCE